MHEEGSREIKLIGNSVGHVDFNLLWDLFGEVFIVQWPCILSAPAMGTYPSQ